MKISAEDKLQRRDRILKAIIHAGGLTEAELTEQLGLERRTVNNYLRGLQQTERVHKDGLIWYAKSNKAMQIIDQIIELLQQLKDELKGE